MINENDYKLGIIWQDIQHRRIIEIINNISRNAHVAYKYVFDELNFYIKDHFNTEEQYMLESAYDRTEEHIGEHKAFIKKIDELSTKCLEDYDSHTRLSSFLSDWFLNHIFVVDKHLADFLLKYEHNYDLQTDN